MRWFNLIAWPFRKRRNPWSRDAAKFLELTARSRLLSADDLDRACADFDSDRSSDNALGDLCTYLISKDVLTLWQCEKLRSGKWKGFFLDGFCILRWLGKDETTATYLCRETETQKRVAMVVTPPMFAPDGKIRYAIRDLTSAELKRFS